MTLIVDVAAEIPKKSSSASRIIVLWQFSLPVRPFVRPSVRLSVCRPYLLCRNDSKCFCAASSFIILVSVLNEILKCQYRERQINLENRVVRNRLF